MFTNKMARNERSPPSTPPSLLGKRKSRLTHDQHWYMVRPDLIARTHVSMQQVFTGSVRPEDRLHYKVPSYCSAEYTHIHTEDIKIYRGKNGSALNGDLDRFVEDRAMHQCLSESDCVGFGRFIGQPIHVALDDHGYAEWIRSVRAPSGQLAGVQALLFVRDRRFNARVAWRRALWHARLFLALWWASEQQAIARGRYAAPDTVAFRESCRDVVFC